MDAPPGDRALGHAATRDPLVVPTRDWEPVPAHVL